MAKKKYQSKKKAEQPIKKVNVLTKPTSSLFEWKWFDKNAKFLVILLTLIGFALRVYRVDFLTLWVDEYIHVMRARDFLIYGTGLLEGENNGVVLTYYITAFFKLFQIDEFWARFPSVVFGTMSIPLIFYLGRSLINSQVGFIAAFLATISWYSIFWSRMARNYASFEFAFLLLLIASWKLFELKNESKEGLTFFDKWGLSKKHLLWLPILLIFAFLNHQLTFFFAFMLGTYASLMAIVKMVIERKFSINKYSVLLIPTILVGAFMFAPFLSDIISPILKIFLPEKAVTWIIPNWDYIGSMFDDPKKKFISYELYYGVISTDYPYLHYIGFIGMVLALYFKRKVGLFLICFFIIPSLLMSFIFRDPALPRYLLYIYPILLISIGAGVFYMLKFLLGKTLPMWLQSKSLVKFGVMSLTLWALFADAPFNETKAFLNTEVHGRVAPKELSHWAFSDWKYPSAYVGKLMQEGDEILSTVPKPTDFYLGINTSKRFRQRHLDTKIRQYVMNDEPTNGKLHAFTTQGFINLVNSTPRGWLLADYYFYNALTDPQARQFAIQNLNYHFDASRDGGVDVFSWDRNQPRQAQRSILVVLGKGTKMASQEMTMDMPFLNQGTKVRLVLDVEAIDHNQEGIIMVNKKNSVYIPKAETTGREQVVLDLDKSWFKEKGNVIQFGYNQNQQAKGVNGQHDLRKGFVVYNVSSMPI